MLTTSNIRSYMQAQADYMPYQGQCMIETALIQISEADSVTPADSDESVKHRPVGKHQHVHVTHASRPAQKLYSYSHGCSCLDITALRGLSSVVLYSCSDG